MKYIVTINGKQYEVEVERGQAQAHYIGEAQQVVPQVTQQTQPEAKPQTAPVASGDGTPINAPMPGKILEVCCKNGQSVKSGDVLFILEAMKMENEIFAGKDGTVTSVLASTGDTVDTGAVLATVM